MNGLNQLLKQHAPREGDADLYGVILYSRAHAHMRKLLRDNDYWAALDELSGPQWAVFSAEIKQGKMDLPTFPPGTMGYMTEVWIEPAETQRILDYFGLDSSEHLPVLVVFSVDDEGHILQRSLPIKEDTVKEAYASLKESFSTVAKAVSGIKDQNLKETYGVHAAVNLALDDARDWKRVKKALAFWMWLKGLTG